jgi:hypothetical protein
MEWDGVGDPLDFVVSVNLHRRHLSPSQRAILANRLRPMFEARARQSQREHGGTAPGRQRTLPTKIEEVSKETATQVAKVMGVSKGLVYLTYLRAAVSVFLGIYFGWQRPGAWHAPALGRAAVSLGGLREKEPPGNVLSRCGACLCKSLKRWITALPSVCRCSTEETARVAQPFGRATPPAPARGSPPSARPAHAALNSMDGLRKRLPSR